MADCTNPILAIDTSALMSRDSVLLLLPLRNSTPVMGVERTARLLVTALQELTIRNDVKVDTSSNCCMLSLLRTYPEYVCSRVVAVVAVVIAAPEVPDSH